MRQHLIRSIPGILGLLLVVAGVWGKWGWEWAAIVAGSPVAAFYIWGEVRSASPGVRE